MREISLKIFQNTELIPLAVVCGIAFALLWFVFHKLPKREKTIESVRHSSLPFVRSSKPKVRYTRKDWFIVITSCVLYGIVSFWMLGSNTFPTTTWQPQAENASQSFILELYEGTAFDQINAIYEESDNNALSSGYQLGFEGMTIEGSNDLISWTSITTLEKGSIYEYEIITGDWDYRYIRITSVSAKQTLTEIAFKAADEDTLLAVRVYEDAYADSEYPAELVIDEQDSVVLYPTYYDEAYFDEIYHPRNAKEIADGQHMYATVHPLVGTNIMALFIKLFGFTPLIWRLPGAVFGVMIIPVFYAILKLLFKDTRITALGTILCAADFMHLTTSRIGTLEPFSVFFILVMYYYMLKYFYTSFYDTSFKKTLKTLFLCGIFMGIAIATKWTACYSAVGLAGILFTSFFLRFQEYRKAKKALCSGELTDEQISEAQHITSVFPKYFWITIALCFVFFIFIPVIIYWLSYLPDHVWRGESWSIANVWEQNVYMYTYHMNLTATHPYSSTWYMWLVDARPIWYYSGVKDTGISHSIACFSNPLLTWIGLPAVIYMIYRMIRRKNTTAWVIFLGYITAIGPWILVDRCVFAYHFYPTSFFTMLAICFAAKALLKKDEKYIKIIYAFEFAYILLFIAFLPVTAGFGTTKAYIKLLEWFPSWYFG